MGRLSFEIVFGDHGQDGCQPRWMRRGLAWVMLTPDG
jgi:hypothetical protein